MTMDCHVFKRSGRIVVDMSIEEAILTRDALEIINPDTEEVEADARGMAGDLTIAIDDALPGPKV